MKINFKFCKNNVFSIRIYFPYKKDIYILVSLGFIVSFTNKGIVLSIYIYIALIAQR